MHSNSGTRVPHRSNFTRLKWLNYNMGWTFSTDNKKWWSSDSFHLGINVKTDGLLTGWAVFLFMMHVLKKISQIVFCRICFIYFQKVDATLFLYYLILTSTACNPLYLFRNRIAALLYSYILYKELFQKIICVFTTTFKEVKFTKWVLADKYNGPINIFGTNIYS